MSHVLVFEFLAHKAKIKDAFIINLYTPLQLHFVMLRK